MFSVPTYASVPEDRRMDALRLHQYGRVEDVRLDDVPIPTPGEGQVLVQVRSTSINPLDLKIIQGTKRTLDPPLPFTLGWDIAGEVVSVGTDVEELHPGSRVIGLARGAFAEYVVVDVADVAPIPPELEYAIAGTCVPVTVFKASVYPCATL